MSSQDAARGAPQRTNVTELVIETEDDEDKEGEGEGEYMDKE